MAEEKLVKVTNRNVGITGYTLDDGRIHRRFEINETKTIPLEELKALAANPGGEKILRDYLIIDDKSALEALDLSIEPEYYYKDEDIEKILLTGELDLLEDTLNFAPKGVIEIIKKKAVDLQLPDTRKRKLILEKTGFSVDNAIMINEVVNADDKPETLDEKIERKIKEANKDAEKVNVTTANAPTRKYKIVSSK